MKDAPSSTKETANLVVLKNNNLLGVIASKGLFQASKA